MTTKKKSFLLHIDSLDILDDLDDQQAGLLFKAIKAYQIGEDLTLDSLVKIAFSPFRNQFARDDEKYQKTCERRADAGSKGGKQKVANASKCKQKVANVADSVNKNKNKTKSDSDNNKEEIDLLSSKRDSVTVLKYLNDSLGTKYKETTKAHIANISARLDEGHSTEDLKSVVNSKKSEWGNDPNMAQYLRPQTLFGNKFQGYLVAAKTPPKQVPAKSVHSFEKQNYTSGKF